MKLKNLGGGVGPLKHDALFDMGQYSKIKARYGKA